MRQILLCRTRHVEFYGARAFLVGPMHLNHYVPSARLRKHRLGHVDPAIDRRRLVDLHMIVLRCLNLQCDFSIDQRLVKSIAHRYLERYVRPGLQQRRRLKANIEIARPLLRRQQRD